MTPANYGKALQGHQAAGWRPVTNCMGGDCSADYRQSAWAS